MRRTAATATCEEAEEVPTGPYLWIECLLITILHENNNCMRHKINKVLINTVLLQLLPLFCFHRPFMIDFE